MAAIVRPGNCRRDAFRQVSIVSRASDDPLELRNCRREIKPGTNTCAPGVQRAQVR
jgi:hypothetical protein